MNFKFNTTKYCLNTKCGQISTANAVRMRTTGNNKCA